jgi:hypothetical protein
MSVDYSEWDKVAGENEAGTSGGGGGGKVAYLKLKGTHTVRPVHKPVEFYKWFHLNDGKLRTAITRDDEVIRQVMQDHDELKKPSHRYAIYVFDRDDGELKIMEAPVSVFRYFRIRYDATGQTPGGKDGGDWQITVTGSGPKNTRYSAKYLKDAPLTKEEAGEIQKLLKEEDRLLTSRYKSHDVEGIEKRLFGEWENNNNNDDSKAERESNTVPAGSDSDMDW